MTVLKTYKCSKDDNLNSILAAYVRCYPSYVKHPRCVIYVHKISGAKSEAPINARCSCICAKGRG